MNNTYDEALEVIRAKKEGKLIECRTEVMDWTDCYHKLFNFVDWTYRVKPEPPKPREWWVTVCRDEVVYPTTPKCHNCKKVHVREVLE